MATRALSKFQYGKEVISTHGTPVVATKILAGAQIKSVAPDRTPAFIPDALGVKARSTRAEIYELLAADTLTLPAAEDKRPTGAGRRRIAGVHRSRVFRAAGHADDVHRRAFSADDDDHECQTVAVVQGRDL